MKPKAKTIKHLHDTYDAILATLGVSIHYEWIPSLVIYHEPDHMYMGEFDPEGEAIYLNLAHHNTTRELVKTLLHEVCHWHQSPSWYTRYDSMYGYGDHPYEIQAWEYAEEHIDTFNSASR